MLEFSYLVAILIGLFLFLLGWFISKMVGNKKTEDLRPQYEALQKENLKISKELKKKSAQVEQLKAKVEALKVEVDAATGKQDAKVNQLTGQINDLRTRMDKAKSEASQMKTERDQLQTRLDNTRKEVDNLKEKYQRDVGAGKEWRKERDKMEREAESLNLKLKRQTELREEYQTKYTQTAEDVAKLRATRKELRMLKSTTRGLEKDVAYWEKKHYDTHHELAALKKDTEGIYVKNDELNAIKQEDEAEKASLLATIREFRY